ncbi:MAG: IS3 family transposase [Candidatus Bathyarchaeia archaeon]
MQARVKTATKSLLSSLFGLTRKSLYLKSNSEAKDELLKDQILSCLSVNPSYGHRRIAIALGIGKKRVRRVMKLYGIKTFKRKARWTKKRDKNKPDSGYPNLIKGSCPIAPKVVYAGDFTRLRWNGKTIYLATFIDLFTREVVGWSMSTRHTFELVQDAFKEVLTYFGKPQIVHTDQGSEYTSKEYIRLMGSLNIQISMSAKASPWENGYQESFFDNFKTDLGLEFERSETLPEFVEGVHKTINYYNNQRIHLSLRTSPTKFRQTFVSRSLRKSVY